MEPNLCRNTPAEDRYYFKYRRGADVAESQSPYYFKVGDLPSGNPQIEANNNKDNQTENEGPYYFRVGSLRHKTSEKTDKDNNGDDTGLSVKQRSQSEPAYFQLEKPSSSVNGDLQQDNGPRDVPTVNSIRKTSISLPITEDISAEYNHLVRNMTLPNMPTVVESSHYQELGAEDTKL